MAHKTVKRDSEKDKNRKKRELSVLLIDYYRQKPDAFVRDILEIKLNVYQEATLRSFFQSKYSMWVWSRGLSKTWLGVLALVVYCMLYKGTLAGIIAPSFRQSKIAVQDKLIKDLMDRSPFLRSEISRYTVSQAEAVVEFYNGSRITAIPTGDGNKIRGYKFHIIMADRLTCQHIQ